MNLVKLLEQIQNSLEMLVKREPEFTGSILLEVHFLHGIAKEVVKTVERTRQKIKNE
jgi:hypothetical protein